MKVSKDESRDIYVGDWVDGQMHGEGKWIMGNGEVYAGSMVLGYQEGKGSI